MSSSIKRYFISIFFYYHFFICLFFCQCNENASKNIQEDYKTGNINVCIDETYKPVFEEILKMFATSFPNALINAFYKPEVDCIKALKNDSFRLVFMARKINDNEVLVMEQKLEYKPRFGVIAYDGIAVIGHPSIKDSTFTIQDITDILSGKNKKYYPIVDGLSQSSVIRYLSEKLMHKKDFTEKLKGSKNSKELLENIATHQNYIGFVGVNWVGNKEDSFQLSFLNKIKILAMSCQNCEQKNIFVKPYQANLALNKYPFLREISYVLKENYEGVGRGLVSFISNERGQLIFKRAYLVPAKINFNVRNVKLSQ